MLHGYVKLPAAKAASVVGPAGQESERVRAFKEALGLTDADAAPVHLDVGRRLVRSSYEAGSREANALEKKVCATHPVGGAPLWHPSSRPACA